jgi:hypothetical protein
MQEHPTDIDILLSDAGDFLKTRTTLYKYKAIESLADVSGSLVSGLALLVMVFAMLLLFSVGFALLIGEWLGKGYYGFFIVGGVYALITLILFAGRHKLLKEAFSNMLVRKILNKAP